MAPTQLLGCLAPQKKKKKGYKIVLYNMPYLNMPRDYYFHFIFCCFNTPIWFRWINCKSFRCHVKMTPLILNTKNVEEFVLKKKTDKKMKKFSSKGQCIGEINIKFWIQIVAFTISTFCGNVTCFKESYICIKLTGSMELPSLNSHFIKRAMKIFWKVWYI